MSDYHASAHDIITQTDLMKQRMFEIESSMRESTYSAKSNGIQVEVNGDGFLTNIFLDPDHPHTTSQALCAQIIAVANEAKQQVESARQNALLAMAKELAPEHTSK